MKIETDTFYVVANISGGYSRPTFVHEIETGTTDSWGDAATADRFDTRKEAEAFIRSKFEKDCRHQYRPMRVCIVTKIYN
jgi:hypothetical protein